MHKYTPEEKKFIREFAFGHSHVEITDAVNNKFDIELSTSQVRAFLKNHKITTGRTGRFEKGQQAHNKGTKMSKEVYEKAKHTMFKKGTTPPNHKPVGTESIRNNHVKGEFYVYVKVAEPNVWRMKHVLEWEKHYGKRPKWKVVIFLDGNPLNTDIRNLELIDRSTHVRLNQNGLRYENQEATKAGISLAQYIEKVSSAKKKI